MHTVPSTERTIDEKFRDFPQCKKGRKKSEICKNSNQSYKKKHTQDLQGNLHPRVDMSITKKM